jgi:hypothetical protein
VEFLSFIRSYQKENLNGFSLLVVIFRRYKTDFNFDDNDDYTVRFKKIMIPRGCKKQKHQKPMAQVSIIIHNHRLIFT